MPWLALTLEVERAAREAFSDALLEAGAQSASIENDAVCALLGMDLNPGVVVAAAAASAGIAAPQFRVETLEDRDWVRASQAQFAPIAVGSRLWVGPSWHEPPPGRIAVRIDPGLAFGTGSHPSTRLVLGFLDSALKGGERVLDYGCGSGILAIAAAKLGKQFGEKDKANKTLYIDRARELREELKKTFPSSVLLGDVDAAIQDAARG